ncbi:YkgJ family cysteine cluster protein [bacterium]|nr:YkgJ family cysteine cluster protein [bacterium]
MSPCENCHAGCCRAFAVPLTGADILRIERGLNLSFWDFACRWADPVGQIAQQYAPHFYFDDEPGTPFVIALMHRVSEVFPETTCCRFLTEGVPNETQPLGQSHCGIYDIRPAACRVFPTKFNATGELALIQDIPDRTREGDNAIYDLCSRQWEPSDLDPVQPLHDLIIARYEMQFFHQLAEQWNQEPRPWEIFPDFLRLIYSQRLMRESATTVPTHSAATPDLTQSPDDAPTVLSFPDVERQSRAA